MILRESNFGNVYNLWVFRQTQGLNFPQDTILILPGMAALRKRCHHSFLKMFYCPYKQEQPAILPSLARSESQMAC